MSKTLIYRLVLTALAYLGLTLQVLKDGLGTLLYYTVLSNLLVASFLTYLVSRQLRDSKATSDRQLLRLKGGVTMSIMITFAVYHLMLAPRAAPEDYWNLRNFLVHYLVPLGFFADTLLLDAKKIYERLDSLRWTAFPLAYLVFAIFNGLVLQLEVPGSKDSPFPYFFLNINQYGWETVIQNCLGIFLGYLLAGYLIVAMKRLLGPEPKPAPAAWTKSRQSQSQPGVGHRRSGRAQS